MKNRVELVRNIKRTLAILSEYDKAYLPLSAVRVLLDALMPFGSVWLSAVVLDALLQKQDFTMIYPKALLFLIIIFSAGLISAALKRRLDLSRQHICRAFDFRVPEKTLLMDYELVDDPKTRELRNQIFMDHQWGAGMYSVVDWLVEVIEHSANVLLSTGLLIWLLISAERNWAAMLLYMAAVIGVLFVMMSVQTKWRKQMDGLMNTTGPHLNLFYCLLMESGASYRTGKDVRLYQAYDLFSHYVWSTYEKVRTELAGKLFALESKNGALKGTSEALVQGAGYVLATVLAILGRISAGQVLLFAGAISSFGSALRGLSGCMAGAEFTINRIVAQMNYMELKDRQHKGTLPVEKRDDNEYEIEFRNVSFKYPGQERYALKNVNLKLRIGEKLAVVGLNGSGKTTMVKLLARLYDPTEGQITLNGIDIRKYDREEYRSLFSVVFQDFKLLSFSVGQNVAASADVDEAKVMDALQKAGFRERLNTLPKGIHTALYQDFEEDGVEISGGEAQKIALARALYKGAPFIVLDEPTAALDPIAEADVYTRFDAIVGTRTAVYISHRLSSCRFCDDIAVFEDGRIVQRGSHDELIAKDGLYQRLWNAQAQYYTE